MSLFSTDGQRICPIPEPPDPNPPLPSAAAGAAASSSNTKAKKKKQKKRIFTTVIAETLRASKNASRYMSAFKIVGSQESMHGPIAKQ